MRDAVKSLAMTLLAKWRSRLRGQYATFQDAQRNAGAAAGYEAAPITEIVRIKTEALRATIEASGAADCADEASYLMLLAILRIGCARTTVRVLDFGGACGAHYFVARVLAPPQVKLRWAVIETPAMARVGRTRPVQGLDFFETIPEAVTALGAVDLVYANNSLQYAPEPLQCLRQLVAVDAESVCLTKLPTGTNPGLFFTIQTSRIADNGPGPMPPGFPEQSVSYPLAIMPTTEVDQVLEARYRVLVRHLHPAMLYHRGAGLIRYRSILAGRHGMS